jgi:predicted phage baseplate assembly protein
VASLEVRIDGVRWRQVAGLFGQPPDAPVYEVRTAEDGTSVVQFGDGVAGAVPPTGRTNVTATYRVGAGLQGRVAAGALTTLLAKPAGLAAATNPTAAEGGADPETLATARDAAPRTVRTFGRAVSLRDFEDLVTASGEIAKAYATFVWDGLDRAVHLTIAGQAGALLSDQARRELGDTLRAARDPNHRLLIADHAKVFVELEAGVAVDPDHDRDAVLAEARAAVLAALAFDALRLGQPIHLSELVRAIQDVPGVVFVDVDRLQFKKPAGMTPAQYLAYLAARGATFLAGGVPAPVQGHLRIFPARPDPARPGHILAAELAAVESPASDVTLEPREV